MSAQDLSRVEDMLRRIDELVTGLGQGGDPAVREAARELVENVLDLHGLALARVMAIVAGAEGGRDLTRQLAQDEQVRAVLLLYGLHPDDGATRVREVLERMRPRLVAAGATADLVRVAPNAVSVRVGGAGPNLELLRREIEEAIVNAAPDLDEIVVVLDRIDAEAAMLAG